MSIKFQPKRGCIDHHKIWFPKAVGTFIREGLLIERERAYKRLLPIMENKVCLKGGFILLQRTASIQDEKRLTTDMGGDFLEKKGFYDTLLGRGCLLQK